MNTEINSDDYRCPCCMNYIYINFVCINKHKICENCYMKVNKCPICRDDKISNYLSNNDINMKECKNKHKGCDLQLFHFDNEHELECFYNPFHCNFCNMNIDNKGFENIKYHYNSDCVNIFKYIEYDENKELEKDGKKYHLSSINLSPTIINVENQYFIILIPKISQQKVNLFIFSNNMRYKLSNYKVKLLSKSEDIIRESFIHYNKLHVLEIQLDDICQDNKLLNFVIQNKFIINKTLTEKKIGNFTYFESYNVEGEPGSPGNWTYEDLEEVTSKFSSLFRNK